MKIRKFSFLLVSLIASSITQIVNGQDPVNDESILYKDLPFKMEKIVRPSFPNNKVNIVDFGAVADGVTLNTKSINNAINAIVAKGGGTVVIPSGLWLTGPINLKDNVCLFTEKGALVRFTADYNEYPLIRTTYEGSTTWRATSPLNANGAKNIAIVGEGVFDGNGNMWRYIKKPYVNDFMWRKATGSGGYLNEDKTTWYPTYSNYLGNKLKQDVSKLSEKEAKEIIGYLRPVLLSLVNCKNILIDGVTFQNPPAWTLHPLLCENLILSNVKVCNQDWQINSDALDLESCKNTLMYNCTFDAGDDAICLKSGKDEEGRKRGVPTENVIIYNCKVYRGHGGFVVGSEMSGGVKNVKIWNCIFMGTDNGLRFKSTRGRGGMVENIYISDIKMIDIVRDAILYDLYYANGNSNVGVFKANETTPSFRNIYMTDIYCSGAERAILFQGLPEMKLQNVTLVNSTITANNGVFCNDADGIIMKNVNIIVPKTPVISISGSENLTIENFKTNKDSLAFVNISGTNNSKISFNKGIKASDINFTEGADLKMCDFK
jgi:polygalacturonase